MHAQNIKKQDPAQKQKKPRKLLWFLVIALGLIVLAAVVLPFVASSSAGRAFLLSRVNRSLDGTLEMEDLSFGWLSGVKIKNLSFADSSGQTHIRVDSIAVRPKLMGLLAGNISLADAIVERPDVRISIPQAPPVPAEQKRGTAAKKEPAEYRMGPIDLQVRQGSALIEKAYPAGSPQRLEVRNFASTVQLEKPGKPSSLDLSMNLSDGRKESTIAAKGEVTTTRRAWGLEGLSGQFEMEVESLSLSSLTPLLALAGKDVQMAGMLNAKADIKISDGQIQTLNATADLTDFEQEIGGKQTRLEKPVKAAAKISAQGGAILIDTLSVESTFFHLVGKGGLDALDYTLTADLAQTQEVAGSLADFGGYAMKGAFSGSGKVVRQEEKIRAVGRHEIRDFSLRQEDKMLSLASVSQTFDVSVDTAASEASITETTLTADPGRIQIADGTFGWSKPDLQATMKLTGNVDLQKARPAIDFFYALPAEVSIAGQARTDLSVDMKDGKAQLSTQATAIDNLKVEKKGAEPFFSKTVALKANVLADVKNKTLLQLSGLELLSDPIRLKGQLKQSSSAGQTALSGQMEAQYDLKQVTAIASPFLPEGLALEGTRQDRFEFFSKYPQNKPQEKMKNLQASGKFGFSKAEYKGLLVGPSELSLRAEKGLLAVDLSDTSVNQGTLRLAGDIDLGEETKVFRLRKPMQIIEKVQINDELTHALLENVNPFFAGAAKVSGIADFSCQELVLPLGGARQDLFQMKSTLAINQLNMQSEGFLKELLRVLGSDTSAMMTLHPTELVAKDQTLSYQNMQLDIGKNPVNFSGQVGPDRRLKLTMQLPWTMSGTSVRPDGRPADRITVPIRGTIQKPEVDWGKTLQMNLGNILLKEILK